MKYFKERKKEYKLSQLKDMVFQELEIFLNKEQLEKRTAYLIEILGDVEMTPEIFKIFIEEFQKFGGPYDVRTEESTIIGIYQLQKKYKNLSKEAIEEIWNYFIKDLFDEYDLILLLEKLISVFKESDDTFKLYLEHIVMMSKKHQKKYKEDARNLDYLIDEYSKSFIEYLKRLIVRKHYKYNDVVNYLPDKTIIEKDEKALIAFSNKTRIYFGCCIPASYKLIEKLIKGESLDDIDEQLMYKSSFQDQVKVPFTKTELLESIKNKKNKVKKLV